MGRMYGYARVSSREQNLARQVDALKGFGVEEGRIFADKASGRNFERPAWLELVGELERGDVLVVKSIDRFGRGYEDILREWRVLVGDRGVDIVVMDMPLLDTRSRHEGITGALISDIVLQLLSYVAQVERENIKQRQAEGIAAARLRGKHLGRPRKERPASYPEVRARYVRGKLTRAEAAEELGVSVSTLDRWLKEDRLAGEI